MVQTFGTDSNNDLYLARDGNVALLSGIDAILDACETASKAQLGEMVFAIDQGIPNFQAIWIGSPNYLVFESKLRSTLLGVEGVLAVTDLQITMKNNVLKYTATIQTQFGTAELNG